jgi:hypothetical protein
MGSQLVGTRVHRAVSIEKPVARGREYPNPEVRMALQTGRLLGNYRIVRLLGEGGFGEVSKSSRSGRQWLCLH